MSAEVRTQILETAARLFYGQGFSQTGINQLIEESGVARRTFYRYFESKELLGAAYLELAIERWLGQLRASSEACSSALATVNALFGHLTAFAEETHFRGCGMLNMTAEFADAGAELRRDVRRHKQAQRTLIRKLLSRHGVASTVGDQVHVLFEGAIAAAAAHIELWPIRTARQIAQMLVLAADTKPHPKNRQRQPL